MAVIGCILHGKKLYLILEKFKLSFLTKPELINSKEAIYKERKFTDERNNCRTDYPGY